MRKLLKKTPIIGFRSHLVDSRGSENLARPPPQVRTPKIQPVRVLKEGECWTNGLGRAVARAGRLGHSR